MAPPPLFSELGKSSRDLFSRGYIFGHIKLDTTMRSGDLEFKTNCVQNIQSGKLFGGIDIKYKIPNQGILLTERWNTDNTLSAEILLDKKSMKGSKLFLETAYAPYVGKRSGKIKTEFKHDWISINADVSIDSIGGPNLNVGGVLGYGNFYIGASSGIDYPIMKWSRPNIGVAFDNGGEFGIHCLFNNGKDFGCNLFHRVSDQLELAASANWTRGEQPSRFGVAAKYGFAKDTNLHIQINQTSQFGIGLTHTLKPGLKFTIFALINLPNYIEGGHKLSFGIEIDAPPVRKTEK